MTIFGWDMSHFDSPGIGTAISEGISFITHKAGGDQDDQDLSTWWSGVRDLPGSVVLGAYWVLFPGQPAQRADAFLRRLDAQCPGWRDRDSFILQADCEVWNGDWTTRPTIAEINAFCDRLMQSTGGKYCPIAYAPSWVYGDVSTLRYPVWASEYGPNPASQFAKAYPGDRSTRWAPYGKGVAILQYGSKTTIGGQTTCDANAFRGTLDELKTLLTPGGDMITPAEFTEIRKQVALGTYDALWSAAKGVDVGNPVRVPFQGVGDAIRANLQALTVSPGDVAAIKSTLAAVAASAVDGRVLATNIIAGLIDPLRAAVLAALPADIGDEVTQRVNAAIDAIHLTVTPPV